MSFDFEKEAFRASGISEEDLLAEYRQRLVSLHRHFVRDMKPGHEILHKAKALFDWLWIQKASRYQKGGPFRLNDAIDSQLSRDRRVVGNCLGLTLLYNTLARRLGIEVGALYLERAFGIGPHVLTVLQAGDVLIDIEHTLPEGYNYQGHLDSTDRARWGEKELVADIYHSRANECYERGEYEEALELYEMAIVLNPRYEKAYLNKAIVLDRMEKEEHG
jgi:tetratricopeptide (TPR) repeat protein